MESSIGEPRRKAVFLRQCDGFLGVGADDLRLAPITMESLPCHCQRITEVEQMLGLARVSQPLFGGFDGLADPAEELES